MWTVEKHLCQRESKMKPIKILLVDDEEQFRISTAKVLKRRGFTVDTVESGEQALEYLGRQQLPDLVLLDLKMEVMDGISTLEVIRQALGNLPVIILTGHGGFDDALASIHLEVIDFIQKPVDIEKLAIKIRSVLSKKNKTLLREKTVAELMVPVESYEKVYEDRSASEALRAIYKSSFNPVAGKVTQVGHRSILIMNRNEQLVGMLRMLDVLEMVQPKALVDSPYSSYFTGMFLAQCKVLGDRPISDFIDTENISSIKENTPLMEALVLMTRHCLINLPVLRDGKVVGILRDRDLFLEIARNVLGE